jgi:hypothetical protein
MVKINVANIDIDIEKDRKGPKTKILATSGKISENVVRMKNNVVRMKYRKILSTLILKIISPTCDIIEMLITLVKIVTRIEI